ncbi:hypothetical protein XENOCAPTIV_008469 [Xenoophorus captivus]|uniref:Uncharacterized protein n=1 Tax=Xenoophorus captivus TaxID=1517983 RepID=A0ABV0Q9I8_9TELE
MYRALVAFWFCVGPQSTLQVSITSQLTRIMIPLKQGSSLNQEIRYLLTGGAETNFITTSGENTRDVVFYGEDREMRSMYSRTWDLMDRALSAT